MLDKTRLDGSKVTIAEVSRLQQPPHGMHADGYPCTPPPLTLRAVHSVHLLLAQAKVGDASGCIVLTVKNEQIPVVSVGASVTIRNAKVLMYHNHMRLAVDQWGLVEASAQPLTETVNAANNLSDTEYELVDA